MKEKKAKIKFQFPKSLDPTRDKYDPELDKLRDKVGVNSEKLDRVNRILEKTPIPTWILEL
jgi:hypothetical protein